MLRFRHGLFLIIGVFCQAGQGGQLQLTLNLDQDARQFLLANHQAIILVLPTPTSEGNNVVAATVIQPPIGDSITLIIDADPTLYVSAGQAVPSAPLTIGVSSKVVYGDKYSFEGVHIFGNGEGQAQFVGIYYNAPTNAQPVITGLALFIYDQASGKPPSPLPINYYTLNRFQSVYIPQPVPVAWVMVGSGISTGSLIPSTILVPATPAPLSAAKTPRWSTAFQLGRYLEVTFNSQNKANVHFDAVINSFVDGPYPSTPWIRE